jgi:hypothetical protein
MIGTTILYILLVVFLATLIQSTFGFGQAVVAVPLLALVIPLPIVSPLVVLLSITIGVVVVIQDWREVHLSSVIWLLVPTFLGIPLGIALLASSHPHIVKGLLAIVIVAFAGNSLLGRKPPALPSDSRPWLLGCGFFAGVLGGAYGMNGPPVVMYGAMRGWSPQHFRATLQGYFLISSLVALAGYWYAGLWVTAVTRDFLMSVLVTVPAIFLGRVINRRLRSHAFLKFAYAALVCIGVVLLIQATRGV